MPKKQMYDAAVQAYFEDPDSALGSASLDHNPLLKEGVFLLDIAFQEADIDTNDDIQEVVTLYENLIQDACETLTRMENAVRKAANE